MLDCSTLRYRRQRRCSRATATARAGRGAKACGLDAGARRTRDESQEAEIGAATKSRSWCGGREQKCALGTWALMTLPNAINQRRSLDFVSDALSDGRQFGILCISRERLAAVVDTSLGGCRWCGSRNSRLNEPCLES